jgi:hypothetical protein
MLLPTWRMWMVMMVLIAATAFAFVKSIHGFLAVNRPVHAGLLVVEGWAADYALKTALEEFRAHPYKKLVVTGGPLDRGAPLSRYGTYAELGAASLAALGLTTNDVVAVAAPAASRDRTYASAVAFEKWKRENFPAEPVHLVTVGAHARRSWLLFRRALGQGADTGVTAVKEESYDPGRWWASSAGMKAVSGEIVAYTYARCFFSASD